jgi:oligopeptide transport system substrate-binding protein
MPPHARIYPWHRRVPAAAFAVLALLAGCGRSPESALAPAATAEVPQVYRYGNSAEPQDIDPQVVQGVPEFHVIQALYDGLVNPDPRDLHPIPGLASSWDISPDGRTYTFHLREGARWSDGSPITTDDVVLSWKRMMSPKLASEYSYLFTNFVVGAKDFHDGKTTDFSTVGITVPDAHSVRVQLLNQTPFLLNMIATHYSWDVLPIKVVLRFGALDERSTQWTRLGNFVGSGPFMLKEWVPQEKMVVVRNPNYWDAARVRLDEVDFLPTEDIPAEERMFRAGQLDKTQEIPTAKIATYRAEHPELLHIDPYLGLYYYRCNVSRPPLTDKRVRRALALAIDRESIVRNVTRGGEVPAYAVSYPGNAGYTSRAQLKGTLDDARRLLADAGFPGGKGLPPIQILYNTSSNNKQIAEAIQEMWRTNLGVESELLNQEWKVYLDSQHTQNFQMERAAWIADYADPHVFLEIWEGGNGNNDTTWSNPDYDRILHASLAAPDTTARYEDYQKLDAILVDECPVIPIFYYTRPYLMSTKVKGTWPNVLDIHPFQDIYKVN